MSEQISFTIPVTPSALNRTITMLKGMADDLHSTPSLFDPNSEEVYHDAMGGCYPPSTPQVAVENVVIPTPEPTPTPNTVTPTPNTVTPTPNTVTPTPNTSIATPNTSIASLNEPVEDDEDDVVDVSGGLDTAGIAWDARIHAATMTKIANGTWKRKKGVDASLVAQVEMEQVGIPTPTPAPMVEPTPTPMPEPTPAPVATVGITTFPALMAAVTGKGIQAEQVLEACKAVDLPSLQILPTRPDLIPTVAMILGL